MGRRSPRGGGKSAEQFGKFLRERRGARSRADVLKDVKALGITISEASLLRYEEGVVPDVAVLHGLGLVYALPFDGLTNALRHELTQRDTSREEIAHIAAADPGWHRGTGKTPPAPHVAPLPQTRELEKWSTDRELVVDEIIEASQRLAEIAQRYRRPDRKVARPPRKKTARG